MRIHPTALGCKGLLLLAALVAAFLATAYSNLFFLLIAFCVAIGGLGAWWTLANLRGLAIVRLTIPAAAAGQPRNVRCVLTARRPRGDLQLSLLLADGAVPIGHVTRVAGQGEVAAVLPPRPRGVTSGRAVRIATRFPFGLFVARVDLPLPTEVVTYPDPAPSGEQGADDADSGRAALARGATAQELRPFRTGDALGDVHWKATARRGQPVVKERDRDGDRAPVFVLDRRCTPAALETALATVTGAVLAARDGKAVRLHSQDLAITVARDGGGRDTTLRWLAAATPLPAEAPPPPPAAGAVHLPRLVRSPAGVSP